MPRRSGAGFHGRSGRQHSTHTELFAKNYKLFQFARPATNASAGVHYLGTFISAEPLYRLIPKIVSLEAIRQSTIALRIVAANWATGEVKVFTNKDMTDDI